MTLNYSIITIIDKNDGFSTTVYSEDHKTGPRLNDGMDNATLVSPRFGQRIHLCSWLATVGLLTVMDYPSINGPSIYNYL